MTEKIRWLVIVVISKAEEKLKELGLWGELEDDLRAKRPILLYNLPERKRGRKKSDPPKRAIALPLESGKGALLLQPHAKGRNMLVCQGVYPHPVHPEDNACFFHELPGNVEIRIEDSKGWHCAEKMARGSRAVDCVQLRDEVFQRKEWNPSKGGGKVARKWRAYIDIRREMLESQRIHDMPAAKFQPTTDEWRKAVIVPAIAPDEREALSFKIDRAVGEDFECRLTPDGEKFPLGELVETGQASGDIRLTFKLAPGFRRSLEESIRKEFGSNPGRLFAVPAGCAQVCEQSAMTRVKSMEAGGKAAMKDAPQWDFYLGEAAKSALFSCPARRENGAFCFAADGLIPRQMLLSADYYGDIYQLNVMERGIDSITRRDIWKILAGEVPSRTPQEVRGKFPPDSDLNKEQKRAVQMALGNRELTLIWGPPGTGKTKVIAEIARQQAEHGRKTLIASQANLAVDNALARLCEFESVRPFRVVRTGREYKLEGTDKQMVPTAETAGGFFLDRLVERLDQALKARVDDETDALRRKFRGALSALQKRRGKNEADMDGASIDQMRGLHIKHVNVVGATLMGTGQSQFLRDVPSNFDTVIVDEVSKALPPELILPILRGKSGVTLVGDHRQLSPILKDFSEYAERDKTGMPSYEQWAECAKVEVTAYDDIIFKQLWDAHDNSCRMMLTKQYRMHEDIQNLIAPFYRGDDVKGLECGLSHEEMSRMTVFPDGIFANKHVAWIDTKRDDKEEKSRFSFMNAGEVRIVGRLLDLLPRGRRRNLSVGVITFYGAQLQALREKHERRFSEKFFGGVNFGTVDRFQGRECDIIICSLVRNNRRGNVGFASVPNRINVAFSRARRLLLIVGNSGQFLASESVGDEDSPFAEAYQICREKGVVCSEKDIKTETERQRGRKRGHVR